LLITETLYHLIPGAAHELPRCGCMFPSKDAAKRMTDGSLVMFRFGSRFPPSGAISGLRWETEAKRVS
jgi:hypothetical protein